MKRVSVADARSQIGCFLEDVNMTQRIHSSLGYLTPVKFETAWRLAHRLRPPSKNHKKTAQF